MTNTQNDTQNDTLKNDNRFEELIKRARALGTESVKGEASKPNHALELVRGIVDEVLDTQEKIDQHFDVYMDGRTKAVAKNPLLQGNAASDKAQKSKQKQIAEMAKLPAIDGVELLSEVNDRRAALIAGEVKVKPAYDAYVDVARAQLKQPLEQITGEALDAIIKKAEPKEKDTLAKLAEEYKRIYKINDKMAEDMLDCTYIEQALASIGDAITALDGEVPSMTKAAKKEDEVMAFLISKGYSKETARSMVK
jgi:hypothetical protein